MEIFNIKDKLEYLDEVANLEYEEWADDKDTNRIERINKKKNIILSNLDNNNFCKLILIDNNDLIGFISIFEHDSDELPNLTPWYATMYVKTAYRKMGYSRILNDAIIKEAKKRGFTKIYLKTELNNYYEKMGALYVKNINEKEKLYMFNLI